MFCFCYLARMIPLIHVVVSVHIFRLGLLGLTALPLLHSTWIRVSLADLPRPRRPARYRECFRNTACARCRRSTFSAPPSACHGHSSWCWECWGCLFPGHICTVGGPEACWVRVVVARGCWYHRVSTPHLFVTDFKTDKVCRLCYMAAIAISYTNMPKQPLKSVKNLLDLRGFLDRRYSVLAVGAFIAMLGQFIPYYYISTIFLPIYRPKTCISRVRHIHASHEPDIPGKRLSPPAHERL